MSTKPMKPLPQQQVQVDLKDADTMKCQSCENTIFIQGYVVKKISAIVSPTGNPSFQLWKLWRDVTITGIR